VEDPGSKVEGDGLVYEGTESEFIDLKVVDPSLTTRLLRLPSTIYANAGSFVKPPYLYGLIGILCVAGGGAAFYIRRTGMMSRPFFGLHPRTFKWVSSFIEPWAL